MKKIGLAFLILILVLSLFVGCGEKEELDYKVMLGEKLDENECFYVVAEESYGELDILHVQYSDGVVLFTARNYHTGDVGVSTYNIHTGERSAKLSVKTASAMTFKSGFSSDGRVYTFDTLSNSLTFYDDKLNEAKKTNLVNVRVGELFVSGEYALSLNDSTLLRVELANNAVETLYSFDGLDPSSLRFIGSYEDEILIAGHDYGFADKLFSCDAKSGECAELGAFDGKLILRDSLAVNDKYDGEILSVYDYSRPDLVSTLYLENVGEQLIGAGNGVVFTSLLSGGELGMTQTLRVYSLSRGTLVSKEDYRYGTNIREVFAVDSDFALFEAVDEDKKISRIILWKYTDSLAEPVSSENLIALSLAERQEKANEQYIERIYQNYNVRILAGEDAVRYYPDYVVLAESDPKVIGSALISIESSLAKFPEGFFSELVEKGSHDELDIVLCKKLLPSHTGSLDAASGYFTETDGQYILVSLAAGDIENTLAHEMMHAVEAAMHLYSHNEFSEWNSFNPIGFEYKNSYVDPTGKEYDSDTLGKYTPYDVNSAGNMDNVAFFDYYSKTYEKEDRARIFEMLMKDELSSYFDSKTLAAKAAYLIERIDAFFECVNSDTDVAWNRIMK